MNLKLQYRKQLIQLAIQSIAEPNPKKITVLQAMNMISLARSQATTTTIKNCFKKAGFVHRTTEYTGGEDVRDDDTIIYEDDWNLLAAEATFDEYMDCDEDVVTSAIFTVDELIQNTQSEPHSDSEDDVECQQIVPPTFQDAMNSIETLRTYFLYHNTSDKFFQDLDSLHRSLIKAQRQSSHQTTVDNFFCKLNGK
ncbi:tigger transposable element-derived protein 6-like [Parasteatoda tepidariorum]|uniref:tigger transposable element-derived protein 6-like n=1 Tax=Parasteatoda tepidariorum TaxID=114398 RepID=UPI001C725280|nr:uncharacterized protein LOC122269478 [Parasteatoda tepidariorum]